MSWLHRWWLSDNDDDKWPEPVQPNPRRRRSDSRVYKAERTLALLMTHGWAVWIGAEWVAPFVHHLRH